MSRAIGMAQFMGKGLKLGICVSMSLGMRQGMIGAWGTGHRNDHGIKHEDCGCTWG